MIQIIPAILDKTPEDFGEHAEQLKHSLSFQEGWVHIDLADNQFVPNQSIRPSVMVKYPLELHKEAHLMVLHPLEWINELVEAGFERIIFHIEAKDDLNECIDKIKSKGLEVGLAIKNETSLEELEPFMDKLDVILLMGVAPGFQGQEFIPETINKVKETSRLRSKGNYNFRIGVDGAVKDDNIKDIVEAGVDFVTVGSFLLKGDPDENLERLWEAVR